MLGGSSLRLGTIFGIRVGVNASWFVILFLAIFWLQDSFERTLDDSQLAFLAAVATAFGFFGSILLHELGHAVATRSPGQEFRVAVAGPLVTLAIVFVGGLLCLVLLGGDVFLDALRMRASAESAFELWLSFLVAMNVLLLVFNLLPAFPLDGGRIARAVAWRVTGDRGRETRLSDYLGQGFAALMIVY